MEIFEERLYSYMRNRIEENAYKRIVKNLLCLAYALSMKDVTSKLFVCAGCVEGQANQQGHACVILDSEDIIDRYFEEALSTVNHLEVEKLWSQFTIQSCIPSRVLQPLMEEECFRSEDYVKQHFSGNILKFVKKIDIVRLRLFV